jgi:hypothetical protein
MVLNTLQYWRDYIKDRAQRVAATLPAIDIQSNQVEPQENNTSEPAMTTEASTEQETLLDLSNSLSSIELAMNSSDGDAPARPNTTSAR